MKAERRLAARLEPFDSYWQAPEDIERGYESFYAFYKANYLHRLPEDRGSKMLVVSCGPGYFVEFLRRHGYQDVSGIDSDPEKIRHAVQRGLPCHVARAFEHLEGVREAYDAIVCEQELNHLTKDEMVEFLVLCHQALRSQGQLLAYGLNGANPIVGAESLAQNFDHFNTFTEYSLRQVLTLAGFRRVEVFPLRLYVFYGNPLNYVGLAATTMLEMGFRILFRLYGKDCRIFTKKIGAVGWK